MKKMTFGALSLACTVCLADVDQPDVRGLGGTGYHANGWFTLGASVHSDKDSLLFDNKEEFVLSPRYGAPIRKVVLGVRASSDADTMTRTLWVRPFVRGIETSTNDFACTLRAKPTDFTNVSFDFRPGDKVDAVRICLGESGSGNWRVGLILVFYGEKGADEDDLLRSLAQELPSPENLRIETFTTNSLNLAVDEVVGATGYRFAVERLDGLPRTVEREDFVMAPALSAGWSYGETNHVSFGQYTGTSSSSYPDNKTASDGGHALQIVPDKKGDALVRIVSPEVAESVTECSYVCKASSAVSDRIRLYGRKSVHDEWTPLGEATYVTTSKAYVTNAVSAADGIRQVMFEFSTTGTAANCGLDTLRIVYGGNEAHVAVRSADEVSEAPTCALDGLESNARYAFRVQAVADPAADPPCRDSSWSDEQVVDLSWATVEVTPPTDVAWVVNGAKMTVRWTAVAGADHYLVDVVPTDDEEHPVVSGAKATGTSLTVTVPSVGEYAATVTAVSPGCISKAASGALVGEVELGTLASVTLKAVERQAVEASWTKVPLAEGYQAKLFVVGGDDETRREVESVRTADTKVSYRNLDPNGRYEVTVVPLPSEGEALGATSAVVDLSAQRFRQTGAVPLSRVRGGAYVESFDSLSNVSAKVETRALQLDYWQLHKGSGEAETVLYSSKTNFTAGGVYALCDEDRTPSSFMLGTLAAGTYGCAVGIAFLNDTDGPVDVGTLSFDAIQRTFKKAPASYGLEWTMTAGVTGIDAESEWRSLKVPETAPYVAGDPGAGDEYRQTVEIAEGLPSRIPSGGVLILRWRHGKVTSGPAMAIDNVKIEFERSVGFRVTVR